MSSPARSWSLMTVSSASVNCSRNATSFIPLESGLPESPSVYQDGLGHEPVTVVGSIRSRVAVYTGLSSRAASADTVTTTVRP